MREKIAESDRASVTKRRSVIQPRSQSSRVEEPLAKAPGTCTMAKPPKDVHLFDYLPYGGGKDPPQYVWGHGGAITFRWQKEGLNGMAHRKPHVNGFWYRNEATLRRANGETYPLYAAARAPHELYVLEKGKQDYVSSGRSKAGKGLADWGQVPATKEPKSASKEKPSYYSPVSVDQDGAYKPTTAPASNWPAHGAKGGAKKSKPPAAPSVTRCEFDGETLEVSWTDHNNNSDTWSLEYAPTWWHEVRTR